MVLEQILKGFSDRSVAVAHIRELENFTLDTRSRGGTGQQSLSVVVYTSTDDVSAVASQLRSMHSAAQSTSSTSDSEDSLEDDHQRYQEASSSRYRQQPSASHQQQQRRNPIPSSQSQSFASTSSSIRPPLPTSQSQNFRKQSAPAPVQPPRERRQQTTPKRRVAPAEGPSRDTRDGVAPSLPGYGPPRTTADSIRDPRRYESMSDERSRHSDDEEDEEDVRDDIFVARKGEVARATPAQRSVNTLRQTPLLRPAVANSAGTATPGGKPPIDLALDRIQSSLTILNQRLASLESTKRKDAEEANGKAIAVITTENPLKSLFNLIFLQLRLTSSTNSVTSSRRKLKTLVLDIFKSSLSAVGRATLDLLVGIMILRIVKRVFLGEKRALGEVLRKVLLG